MPPRDSTTVSDVQKPKPISKPDEGTRGLTAKPQPNPILQKRFNFHGTVEEFNRRLEVIDKSHRETVGYRPTGPLVYDIARSGIKDEQVPVLFQVPRTKKAAVAASFVRKNAVGMLEKTDPMSGLISKSEEFAPEPLTEDELLDGMNDAAKRGQKAFREFMAEHQSDITYFSKQYGFGQSPFALNRQPNEVRQATIGELDTVGKAAAITMRAGTQITTALAFGVPILTYAEGKAVYESVQQRSLAPFKDANEMMAREFAKSVWRDTEAIFTLDWDYMAEYPGFIALDIMGLGSLALKGGRVGAGGRTTTRKGELEVERLESENPAAALLQRRARRKEQKDANTRHDTEGVFVDNSRLGYTARKHLGFEKKMGKELERERKLKIALQDMVRTDLERVTGWSTRRAAVQDKVGFKAHRGLTRGEQMGLFIESLDVSGSFKDRAAALRAAHEKWRDEGLGDPAAHEQKLRDITLAERALRKPSPRFEKALLLTREAVAEMEELKVRELGLDAGTASARVAKAGEVVVGQAALRPAAKISAEIKKLEGLQAAKHVEDRRPHVEKYGDAPVESKIGKLRAELAAAQVAEAGLTRKRTDSHYVPTVAPRQSRPLAKNPFRSKRFGHYGASLPDMKALVPELSHQFTGKAMQAGDYRIDTTRLVGESVGRTVRAASLISQHQKLLKAATATPRSEFDRPIRTKEGVPVELREILARTDEGELVADEVGALSKMDAGKMIAELFPGQRGPDGRWLVAKEIEGVKWVDERLLDPEAFVQPMQTPFKKVAAAVNAPFTTATLYLRPAYLLNLAGATATAFIYQGMFAPPNIIRAVRAKKLYGEKVNNALRDLVGSGRAASYVEGRPVTGATQFVARAWNTVTDERLRMSTAFFYGRKHNIKTKADWENLLDGAKRGDDQAFKTLNEIVARTKKSMVEFDNLSQFERDVLRHAIFIYPWMRGATVWSVRTMVERPLTTATLAQTGKDELEDIQDMFTERVPEWFKNAGYVPLGYDKDGNPRVVNPAGISTFSTLNSLMHSRIDQMLGPAAELLVRGATERDEFGNEYESPSRGGRWVDAAVDVLTGLPQIRAMERSKREDGKIPPPDVTDRNSLAARLNDALAKSVFSPGWLDGYGKLITGAAATPVSVDKQALLARWYRDASFEERTQLQKELMNRALSVQADLIGKPVALDVKKLVNLQFDRDKAQDAHEKKIGQTTPHQDTLFEIDFLVERKVIPEDAVADLKKQAARLASEEEHFDFRRNYWEQYADPDGKLREWDESVRRVNALATPKIVNERLRRLTENGVNDATGKTALGRTQLVEYGRKADVYTRELKQRVLDLAQLRKSEPALVPAAEAELVAWKSEQDKPVSIQGRLLPSPARMEWAKEWDFEGRKEDVAELASRSWQSLTRFERELLGRKTDAKVVRGWQKFAEIKASEEAQLESGQTLGSKYERFNLDLAKHVDKTSPGFYRDWLFGQEPLARRLQQFRPVQQSKNKADWDYVLGQAVRAASFLKRDGYKAATVRDDWKRFVQSDLTGWLDSRPQFKAELSMYGDNVLEGLIN